MKASILLLSFFLTGLFSITHAITPEEIFPLSQSLYSVDYYNEQKVVWEEYLQTNSEDAAAWMNYYNAARNVNILTNTKSNDLAGISNKISTLIPNSFENHFIQYKQSGIVNRNYKALLKAHKTDPKRSIALQELLFYYEVINDEYALKETANSLYKLGKLSAGILDWNYNALHSVDKNAILLTHGDNDTYPSWVLQQVKGIRPDVKVINLYLLLAEDTYRRQVLGEIGIKKDFKKAQYLTSEDQLKALVTHVNKNSKRPLYLGVAIQSDIRKIMGNNLYLTGLAFRHSKSKMDNLSVLDENCSENFRLESLSQPLAFDPSQTVVNHMNMNYIPSFALLYRYYVDNSRMADAEKTKKIIGEIAYRASKTDEVERYLQKKKKKIKRKKSPIDLRMLDHNLMHIEGDLYSASIETSNASYNAFLQDLLTQRKYEVLEKCQIHPTDWPSFLDKKYKNQSDAVLYYHGYPNEDQHPIVNISQEAAELYCDWITDLYNESDHRKKKFRKVVFRLPSPEEWTIAAKGKKKDRKYPWRGTEHTNDEGCQLANHNPNLQKGNTDQYIITGIPADDDGAYFTVRVDTYFPNGLGLYNMAGNVAEMTDERGTTKGGGWNDPAYYMEVEVENKVQLPSPNVGFRIFMDVIEKNK